MAAQLIRFKHPGKTYANGETGLYNMTNSGNSALSSFPKPPGATDDTWADHLYGGKQYCTANPLASVQTVHTVSFWFYALLNWQDNPNDPIFAPGGNIPNGNFLVWVFPQPNGRFQVSHAFQSGVFCTDFVRSNQAWNHWIGVFHGGYIATSCLTAYKDGVKGINYSYGGGFVAPSMNATTLTYGGAALYSRYVTEYVWDMRMWDYELSDAECRAVYRGYFNQGQGTAQVV